MKAIVFVCVCGILVLAISGLVTHSLHFGDQGPGAVNPDPIEAYHLNECFVRRDVVAEAVSTCNVVLRSDSGIVLRPSWEQSRPVGSLPVYLIDAEGLPADALCFVPDGYKCIFVTSSLFPNLGKLFAEPDPQEVVRQSRDVLTILLLHECGHIHYGDAGSFAGSSAGLNLTRTAAKDRETRADQFAAEMLRKAKADIAGAFHARSVTAMTLMAQTMLINFNFFGARVVNLGSRKFRDKGVYWDDSLTHPNLAFRMLNIAAGMDPENQDAQKNLQDFLDARKPLEDPSLYRSRGS